tara:strand:- start:4841 stop:5506 length:666 start_codon:yes stop_codon:yes gene_type:complete
MKNKIKDDTHFIAHYLAKYSDSYESLNLGNNTQTHNKICLILDISESSFRRLRDEYDGFYNNRKGFPNPEKRKSRVNYKKQFDNIEQSQYIEKIMLILSESNYEIKLDEEIGLEAIKFYEGDKIRIEINKYERNIRAKNECLKHYKRICVICGFTDENSNYPSINIIEVHHVKPLSETNKKHIVDPILDLRPVCPNCHRAIHSKNPAFTIEEFKKKINNDS